MVYHVTLNNMSDKAERFPCPICSKLFPKSVINNHVIICMDKPEVSNSSAGANCGVSSSDNEFSPPQKRQKLNNSNVKKANSAEINHKVERSACEPTDTKTLTPRTQRKNKSPVTSPRASTSVPLASIFQPRTVKLEKDSTINSEKEHIENNMQSEKLSAVLADNSGCLPKVTPKNEHLPLAELMRPDTLENYIGQEQAVGREKILRQLLESSETPSFILWGPPGCGKTTLARIIAKKCKEKHNSRFVQLSATTSGVADVKEAIKVAKNELQIHKRRTVLFIDEIHRFNKVQQDTFLPHVENGTITLIGATTENPSFQVNNALISRCRVIVLEKLTIENIASIVERALQTLGVTCVQSSNKDNIIKGVCIEEDAIKTVAGFCDGDARSALNAIQFVFKSKANSPSGLITVENVKEALQRTHVMYDRAGDEHYHCASALQKSIRGSDDNGAIYWMTRMLEGGEDPLFIARRLVVTASEDIGLADPQALPLAVATFQACQLIGKPECRINLAHCTSYLARAPKSNEAYQALNAAQECIKNYEGPLPGVPLHLRNATSGLARQLGYGKGYKYNHSGKVDMEYLPKELCGKDFFNRTKSRR